MANRKPLDRKALRAGSILVAVGVLFVLAGALVNGEWPTGPAVVGSILAVVVLLLLLQSQRDRADRSEG